LRARFTAVKAMTSNSWHLCSACRQARGERRSEQEACLHAGRGCAKSATRSLLPATQPTPSPTHHEVAAQALQVELQHAQR
jgi:hypothetical protein